MGGPMRAFHYTVFTDRQSSQDGFQVPDNILRNHTLGSGYERLYRNIVAVKNECLPLSDGVLRPYEEAVRVINATMEDTGIIKDVLEAYVIAIIIIVDFLLIKDLPRLIEDHTIGLLAIPVDAIWVEVNPLGSPPVFHFEGPTPSPRLPPDPPHFPDPSDGGLGAASSTGHREGHFPKRSPSWTRRASSLGVPEESSHTGQRGGRFPDPSTWTRRASSLGALDESSRTGQRGGHFPDQFIWASRVLEESSRGGRRGGPSFSRARQASLRGGFASSSHFGGRGRGHTHFSSTGRSVRIQAPGDLTQAQVGGELQSAQLPSSSCHPHAPGSQLDVSPIDFEADLEADVDNNLESREMCSGRAAANSSWPVSPAPSPPRSDESDGDIEYLST